LLVWCDYKVRGKRSEFGLYGKGSGVFVCVAKSRAVTQEGATDWAWRSTSEVRCALFTSQGWTCSVEQCDMLTSQRRTLQFMSR